MSKREDQAITSGLSPSPFESASHKPVREVTQTFLLIFFAAAISFAEGRSARRVGVRVTYPEIVRLIRNSTVLQLGDTAGWRVNFRMQIEGAAVRPYGITGLRSGAAAFIEGLPGVGGRPSKLCRVFACTP